MASVPFGLRSLVKAPIAEVAFIRGRHSAAVMRSADDGGWPSAMAPAEEWRRVTF